MKKTDLINRRKLLENASATILLMPLLRALRETEVFGQSAAAPLAIFFYYGSGSYASNYWPTGSPSSLDSFPVITKPLEAHKESLTFIKGLGHRGGDNHYGGPKEVLAGGGDALYSIDQRLADAFGGNSRKKSIAIGCNTIVDGTHPICFSKSGAPINAQDNPKAAYEDIFGGFTPMANFAGSSGLALANESIVTGRRRMLELVRADMNRIKGRLGKIESQIFERHVSALDDLYTEIKETEDRSKPMMPPGSPTKPTPMPGPPGSTPMPATPGSAARCKVDVLKSSVPTGTGNGWFHLPEINPKINAFNRSLMVEALACGITRFAVMQYGHSESLAVINFENCAKVTNHMHGISHENGPEQQNLHSAIMTQVALTIADLKAIKVGDKSLFDSTLIMTSTCMGDRPNEHIGAGIPTFIAGTLGGKFKGNRILSFPYDSANRNSGIPYNQALLTVAQLMGLTVDTIGFAEARGIVPGSIG